MMFSERRLLFYYTITPTHMGAGQALDVIDNPIQREPHTGWPYFAGSGVKGAVRDVAEEEWKTEEERATRKKRVEKVERWFGPKLGGGNEEERELHAGAVSFTDAQLVAFPVRTLKEGFAYLTSPLAVQRLVRLAAAAGISVPGAQELVEKGAPSEGEAWITPDGKDLEEKKREKEKLVIEAYDFTPEKKDALGKFAQWLAKQALPADEGHAFFRKKLERHLVLVGDDQLSFFARHATFVEPHVRIDDDTGTADDGGLFFTENLPPEAVLAGLVMTSEERKRKGAKQDEPRAQAGEIVQKLEKLLNNRLIQVGGDATTGRGLVSLRVVRG